MSAARFAARHPWVWHVAEAEALDGALQSLGLLPAARLRDLAGVAPDGLNRPDFVRLAIPGGAALLRPQQMADSALARSLQSGGYAGRPADWRALIDQHAFFWTDPRRRAAFLEATRRARARSRAWPSTRPPVLLRVRTAALLEACADIAVFSRFNSGSAMRGGARVPRDETTLRPVTDFAGGPVAELAIRGAIPAALLCIAAEPA